MFLLMKFVSWIFCSISPAESLPVEDNSVTLIQVATALHWFDHEKFYRECDRVLAPGGVIAAFCYSVFMTVVNHSKSEEINKVVYEESYFKYKSFLTNFIFL